MNPVQLWILFLFTALNCTAIVGAWVYWRKHLQKIGHLPPDPVKEPPADTPALAATVAEPVSSAPVGDFPYQQRPVLSDTDRMVHDALSEVLGAETVIFPMVASWAWIEPKKAGAGYFGRLSGMAFDFVLCDASTCQPFCGIHLVRTENYRPLTSDFRRACEAAEIPLLELEADAAIHDPNYLKEKLGVPDL